MESRSMQRTKRSFDRRPRTIAVLAAFLAAVAAWLAPAPARAVPADDPASFAQAVDLTPLATVAVQSDGRVKSLSSLANETMAFVSGPRRIAGQEPLYTYLDMLFRPDAYRDADAIYVKGAGPRRTIADAVLSADASD